MAQCARCGLCCQLIGWNPETGQRSWQEVEILALQGHPDAMFMVAHWRYCWGTGYYWCDCFDFQTHLCTVYEQRPRSVLAIPIMEATPYRARCTTGCAYAQAAPPPV